MAHKLVVATIAAMQRRRALLLTMLSAAGAVGGVAFFLWPRPTQEQNVYREACRLVARHLETPRKATFPEIPARCEEQPDGGWSINAYVDAKNPYGLLIRSPWKVRFKADHSGRLQCETIELDGRTVFESNTIIVARGHALAKAAAAGYRRRAGNWAEVALLTGESSERTPKFRTTFQNWRLRWQISGAAAVEVHSAADEDEPRLVFTTGEPEGITRTQEGPGEFYLRIRDESQLTHWQIWVEE